MPLLIVGGGLGALSAVVGNARYTEPTSDSDITLLDNPTSTYGKPTVVEAPAPVSAPKSKFAPKPVYEFPDTQTIDLTPKQSEQSDNTQMAGNNMSAPTTARRPIKKKSVVKRKTNKAPTTIVEAPISIGNTVRGFQSKVTISGNNALVRGRDFCFTPIGSGSVQTWTLVGGAPLAPAAFVDSTLRQYLQMYNKFRFRNITAHYITSSPTSANGDVMFYYGKNRESVFLNQTSGNLLPFVISDPNTVIGPQWLNHSATFTCSDDWMSTDYGMDDAIGQYADGEIFLLSKTSTTDSPGYVLFDYLIEFKEKSVIPRLLTLPVTKALYTQVGLNINQNTTNLVAWGATATAPALTISGTATALPTGAADGDIYKIIIDRTNSTLSANAITAIANSITFPTNSPLTSGQAIIMNDGTTLYALFSGNGNFTFYPNVTSAYSGIRPLLATASLAIGVSTLQVWMSYVGTVGTANVQPNF